MKFSNVLSLKRPRKPLPEVGYARTFGSSSEAIKSASAFFKELGRKAVFTIKRHGLERSNMFFTVVDAEGVPIL